MKLQNEFSTRQEMLDYLKEVFPDAAQRSPEITATPGGRKAAEERLAAIQPEHYAASRNRLDGAVTRLSPYLRHGVLSLAEVREAAFKTGRTAEKLINELAWRDYFQRVYRQIGDGIWRDREEYKTGFRAEDYGPDLPTELREGRTGLVCMDSFEADLRETGYLHNHARLWLAAYVVHHLRVRWQAGAHWFLEHLLDGDPASNNLSWQWVASTFSSKPYFFNRSMLEQSTAGRYCQKCPLARGGCPFDTSIPELEARLFPAKPTPPPVPEKGGGKRANRFNGQNQRKGSYQR